MLEKGKWYQYTRQNIMRTNTGELLHWPVMLFKVLKAHKNEYGIDYAVLTTSGKYEVAQLDDCDVERVEII